MSIHHLKINKQPFDDLVSGRKTGEVRDCSDRDFKVGDSVELFMTETATGFATESIVRTITHIQRGYGLPDDLCVLSYAAPVVERQPDFWKWLDSAYRDGSEGEQPKFTKYNMEVAYQAGASASVTSILLDVIPGDGDGHEVFAKSVADVEAVLATQGDEIEELQATIASLDSNLFRQSERIAQLTAENERLKKELNHD